MRRTRTLLHILTLVLFVCPVTFGQGAHQLSTTPGQPFTTGAGVTFDVTAHMPVTLHRVQVAASPRSGTASSIETVEVWTRLHGCQASGGTGVPFNDPAGWELAGRADVWITSGGGHLEIPVDLNLFLPSRTTMGIAVYSPTHVNAFRMESPPAGSTDYFDGVVGIHSKENLLYTEQVGIFGTTAARTYYSRRDPVNVAATVSYDMGLAPTTPPSITTPSVADGTDAVVYARMLRGTGGIPPYTWDVSGLPGGLMVEPTTGLISGIPLIPGGTTLDVTLEDSIGQQATASFPMNIALQPTLHRATIDTPQNLPDALEGRPYLLTLHAAGFSGTLTWSLQHPRPSWLGIDPATGTLRGTPGRAHAGYHLLQVEATNGTETATKTFWLGVHSTAATAFPPEILTLALPDGTVGVPYQQVLSGQGGTQPYQWAAWGIPRGMAAGSSGDIGGVPMAPGRVGVQLRLSDATGALAIRHVLFETVPGSGLSLTITTQSLPDATVGVGYQQALTTTGGSGSYQWQVLSGPTWLRLQGAAQLMGMPQAQDVGTHAVEVQVDDGLQQVTATLQVTVLAAATPLAIQSTSLPDGVVGVPYQAWLQATGGQPAYTWAVLGQLPPGLSLDRQTGELTGTPATVGTAAFDVEVTDGAGQQVGIRLSLRIDTTTVGGGSTGGSGSTGATPGGSKSGSGGSGCSVGDAGPADASLLMVLLMLVLAGAMRRRTPSPATASPSQ